MTGSGNLYSEHVYHSENGPAYTSNRLGQLPSMPRLPKLNTGTTEPPSDKIGITKNYLLSPKGIARLILIVFLLGCWISALVAIKDSERADNGDYGGFTSTRIAYLVFSIAAFILFIVEFIFEFFNISSVGFFRKIPFEIIYFGMDIFFLLTMFSVSVACAVRESQLKDYTDGIYDIFNKGAFAAASAFGFIVCIILVIAIIFQALSNFKPKRAARQTTVPESAPGPTTIP